jgi:hypothetical protein
VGREMPTETRKSIVAGQMALLAVGLFFFWLGIDALLEEVTSQAYYNPSFWYTMYYYYLSMPPLQVVLLGTLCMIGAVLLFPVIRYEVKEETEEKTRETEKSIACPNCKQSVPKGSKFCNNCGHKIRYAG